MTRRTDRQARPDPNASDAPDLRATEAAAAEEAVEVEAAQAEAEAQEQAEARRRPPITLEDVQANEELSGFISAADRVTEAIGYTEHGFRHANLTGRIAFQVLSRLGFDEHDANLGCVAGYLHDVGNMVSREVHGQTGALLVHHALRHDVPPSALAEVVAAIANHEEEFGPAVSPISAAVILADKSDVHRSRVRKSGQIDFDIHDRVNFAAEQSFLRVDAEAKTITLELTIDTQISQVMEYFEIFLGRMVMCRRAAETLDCRFKLTINGAELA